MSKLLISKLLPPSYISASFLFYSESRPSVNNRPHKLTFFFSFSFGGSSKTLTRQLAPQTSKTNLRLPLGWDALKATIPDEKV